MRFPFDAVRDYHPTLSHVVGYCTGWYEGVPHTINCTPVLWKVNQRLDLAQNRRLRSNDLGKPVGR